MSVVRPLPTTALAHTLFDSFSADARPLAWPHDEAYLPNFSDWRSGDVLLMEAEPRGMGQVIRGVQASSRNERTRAGAAWSHCGIYIGEGLVIDCVPVHGVRIAPVWAYASKRRTALRRFLDVDLDALVGKDVASAALALFNRAYSYRAISEVMFNQAAQANVDALFCSTFVAVAYSQAVGQALDIDPEHRPCFPGTLAHHQDFVDVSVTYRRPL